MTTVWHMLAIIAETQPTGFPGRDQFPSSRQERKKRGGGGA